MTEEGYTERVLRALAGFQTELNAMEHAVKDSAGNRAELPQAGEIFGTISDAAEECKAVLEFFEGEEVPPEVYSRVTGVQRAICDLAAALRLHTTLMNMTR